MQSAHAFSLRDEDLILILKSCRDYPGSSGTFRDLPGSSGVFRSLPGLSGVSRGLYIVLPHAETVLTHAVLMHISEKIAGQVRRIRVRILYHRKQERSSLVPALLNPLAPPAYCKMVEKAAVQFPLA